MSSLNASARLSRSPRRGRGRSPRASPARSFASVFGPIPGTCPNRPSAAAARNSSTVRTPSARPISAARWGPNPSSRPSPTSSGETSPSNASSSASRPVSTSSRSRASIPGPMPRRSRTRPVRTSSAIDAGVSRIVSAARRYARGAYGLDPVMSSSPASDSSRSAISAFVSATRHSFPVALVFDDEFEHGFGWSTEGERVQRTSHAIRAGGRVWLLDVVDGDGLDERIAALGEPAAVVQLLDRHNRDCAAVAERLGVPLHVTPFDARRGCALRRLPDPAAALLARGRALVRRGADPRRRRSSRQPRLLPRTRRAVRRQPGSPPLSAAPLARRPRAGARPVRPRHRFPRPGGARGAPHRTRDRETTSPERLALGRQIDGSPLGRLTVVRIGHNAASPLSATAEATRNAPP